MRFLQVRGTSHLMEDRVLISVPLESLGKKLERHQRLVWAFDFLFGIEKLFTPWFANAFGALVNRVAYSETVVAGSLGTGSGKLLASPTRLEKFSFERSVLFPQFVFADDAHAVLLTNSNLRLLGVCVKFVGYNKRSIKWHFDDHRGPRHSLQ
jgi:hypothetical protein